MSGIQRICLRLKVSFFVSFKRYDNERVNICQGEDISAEGLGFITDSVLEKLEIITLTLQLPDSLRKLTVNAKVMHQQKTEIGGRVILKTGVQFVEMDKVTSGFIQKFIVKNTSLRFLRYTLLLSGAALFIFGLLRAFNLIVLDSFLKSDSESSRVLFQSFLTYGFIYLHIFYAFGFLICSIGILMFRLFAYNCLIYFAILGSVLQITRLIGKFSFINKSPGLRFVYSAEGIFLLAFIFVILMLRQNRKKFYSILASLKEHISVNLRAANSK